MENMNQEQGGEREKPEEIYMIYAMGLMPAITISSRKIEQMAKAQQLAEEEKQRRKNERKKPPKPPRRPNIPIGRLALGNEF